MMRSTLLPALAALILTLGLHAADDTEFVHPVMRVPKIQMPTVDGKIDAAEWAGAAAFTGVTAEGSVGGHGSLVPKIQQVQWFLGYDDTYLYLAMRSPQPPGTYPVARVKEDDLITAHPLVLFEDHVEVQILSHGRRDQASTQGKGFYKIMANPKAAVVDQYLFNGTIGTEELWSMGGPVECRVTPEAWELEMAVEYRRMKVDKLDGRSLVIQLVRTDSCTGMYFAGWVGEPWMSWSRFAEVDFAPDTPAFRFLDLGDLGAGDLAAKVELVGGKTPAEITVDVLVDDADGKVVYQESRTVALAPGQTQPLDFTRQGLPISKVAVAERDRRNHFEIKATAKIGKQTVTLYHNRSPFMQVDDEFREQFLDKWIAGRPQSGEWEYKVAYLPYSDKLEASVDLDFFGIPEQIKTARTYRVAVVPKGADNVLVQGSGAVADLLGERLLVDMPELPAGDYVARFELVDAAGAVLSTKEAGFTRKVYPWEHNTLGVSDEVIPPFLPLSVKNGNSIPLWSAADYVGRTIPEAIWMWGRAYTVGDNGLLAQVDASAPTGTLGGPAALLAAPMHFEVVRGGETVAGDAVGHEIVNAAMHRVDVVGAQTLGGIEASVKAFCEYDGWYEVEATFAGGAADALDLVVDFDDRPGNPVDTLYVQRLGDGRVGNSFSAIPTQPGVCFRSTDLLEFRGGSFEWKSFVPRTYIGNGDRGLWFFAWSAAGWELVDDVPTLQVERLANGDVRLRVRILGGPVDLATPRTVRFAVQAAPVKPNNPRYRTFNEEGLDMHDTRGYRYYGESVDDFVNNDPADYEALRQFLLYAQRYQGQEQRAAKKNYSWWHGHYMEKVAHGAKIIMYGSGRLTGMGPEEFRTFGGEWLGKSNWTANRSAASDLGRWNYQGTEQWDTDAEVSVTGINWTQSAIDWFVWYHKPLLEKAGFNGTWWDNSSVGLVREYNPDLGNMEEVWMFYSRRQLVKRLHTLGWQVMRPPMWASNMHVDLGFAEVFWMVENDWYADGADMTSLQQWPMGQFRAMARTKSTMQVARPWLSGFHGTTPERDHQVKRSVWAMLLSHDIHPAVLAHYSYQKPEYLPIRRAMANLRGLVNLPDTGQCLFAGYWKTAAMVQPAGHDVHASVYSNANLRTAAVVLFNGDPRPQYLAGTALDVNALIPIRNESLLATRIFDIETGEVLATVFEDGRYVVKAPLLVPGHDFRLIGIEAQ